MKNDIFFGGIYYDSEKINDIKKKEIEKKSPNFYNRLVLRYGYKSAPKTKKAKQDENLELERSTNDTTD